MRTFQGRTTQDVVCELTWYASTPDDEGFESFARLKQRPGTLFRGDHEPQRFGAMPHPRGGPDPRVDPRGFCAPGKVAMAQQTPLSRVPPRPADQRCGGEVANSAAWAWQSQRPPEVPASVPAVWSAFEEAEDEVPQLGWEVGHSLGTRLSAAGVSGDVQRLEESRRRPRSTSDGLDWIGFV